MRRLPFVVLAYIVALSLPGLFSIEANSASFILYQAACLFIASLLIIVEYIKRPKEVKFSKSTLALPLIYMALLTISTVYSVYLAMADNQSMASLAQFFLPIILCVMLVFGTGYSQISYSRFKQVLSLLLIFAVLSSLYNIIVNYEAILNIPTITGSYNVDIKGFFYNRNVFGFMLACGLSSGIFLFSEKKRTTTLFALLIVGANMVFTMSRGAMLFFGIFLVMFLFLKTKNRVRTLLAIIVSFVLMFALASGNDFVQNNIIRSENSDTGRSSLREYGISYYTKGNLFLGSGQQAITAIEEDEGHSSYHNLYIETLVTQGAIGMLALIVILIFAYTKIRLLRHIDRRYYAFFSSLLVAYLIYCAVEALPLFYGTPNSLLMTYLLILLPIYILNNGAKEISK